ncbi:MULTISPECIES: maleylpyruvate isomerase family mycothiol-dependent enzyme [unclassified Streptomyces]|uniref:maleylpyruvate isomerase family mycothiol-dependent enzyme n=1 Tax=unclassified Streptomyces TaxID=2593676 RepID=UPI0022B68267|nr:MULTISPECIES: maleylpyruvate isomerase family mycothiol-dependent enzyme [unclassified Streptomyces]MCZ7415328.1 sterol carrier family protein [Streptomyces sp. WMMC897]MCZ7432251.1 sterol carrier family protein [Streptomyces sp. WMMC1477]
MPSAASRKPRAYDPLRVRNALAAQAETVRAAAHGVTAEQLARPTALSGWDVRHLLVHLAGQIDAVPRLLAEPAPTARRPETSLSAWALSTAGISGQLDARTREATASITTPEGVAAAIDAAIEELEPVLEMAVREDVLLPHRFGAMRALDFAVTRLVELIVHSDDLARALGAPVTLDRYALAATVRALADALAVKVPGGAVELRVPPFAVVQCVEGPRHTRGTPPNVVETDPLTWLRLATGRLAWSRAVGAHAVNATGARADLSAHLPVLA